MKSHSIKISQMTMKELKKLTTYMNLENKEGSKGKNETIYDLAIFNALWLANFFYEDGELREIFMKRFKAKQGEGEEERKNLEEWAKRDQEIEKQK